MSWSGKDKSSHEIVCIAKCVTECRNENEDKQISSELYFWYFSLISQHNTGLLVDIFVEGTVSSPCELSRIPSKVWRIPPKKYIAAGNVIFIATGISITKIRLSWDHLMFMMGILILARWCLHTETAPYLIQTKDRHMHNQQMKRGKDDIIYNVDGLVQDCSISIANAMEILQSCTKSSTLWWNLFTTWSYSSKIFTKETQ